MSRTRSYGLVFAIVANACGPAASLVGGANPRDEGDDKILVSVPTTDEVTRAQRVALGTGEVLRLGAAGDDPAALVALTPTNLSGSLSSMNTGARFDYRFDGDIGDTIQASVVSLAGDADLTVFTSNGARRVDSVKGTGFIDNVSVRINSTTGRQLMIRVSCYQGPCAAALNIARGNDSTFTASAMSTSVYVNQRSFTARSGKCTNSSGSTIADGECMCAPASAANALGALGRVPIGMVRSTASDLFATNNAGGAGNRVRLMERLMSNYGYPACVESRSALDAFSNLRTGGLVLLRSSRFSGAGHYVRLTGYTPTHFVVDDPYGWWSSRNVWSPANTTDATSRSGFYRSYLRASLIDSDASFILCAPTGGSVAF